MGQYTGLENRKILVVEDVELNQFLARHIMESWGCEVKIAENGALALESISKDDFDLVLMDIQMPVMDGLEATKQIRELKDDQKSSVPIVALTANATLGDCDFYIKEGMNDCLPKPFEEPALFAKVTKNIRKNKVVSMNITLESPAVKFAVPSPKIYDLTMVEAISGGDQSFVVKMLQLFLETVPPALRDIVSVTEKREWPELSKLAHKLKSTIDSMGIAEIKQTIRVIESNGKTGNNVDKLPGLVDEVVAMMKRVMEQVKKDYLL